MLTTSAYTLSDFDYDLPESLIAKYPLAERDHSRMLFVRRHHAERRHGRFLDLVEWLSPQDVLVVNNSRVIPARLFGTRKDHTAKVELFLMHPQNADRTEWQVLMRPARRLRAGEVVDFGVAGYWAEIVDQGEGGRGRVRLHWPTAQSFEQFIAAIGQMPIPPYLNRAAEEADKTRYQTVYAKQDGAQAAPTAGLHFTPQVLEAIAEKGVQIAEVTLHVSAGTFRPVMTDNIDEHEMDPEWYDFSEAAYEKITRARANGGRVVAVGTTSMKTLESVAKAHHGQLQPHADWSQLFIKPGFDFQVVDALLTNFHQPKSTLMMLVSAFAGYEPIMAAYREAVESEYRFLSYGDCMLIH